MQSYDIKRGDTFSPLIQIAGDSGTPVDITGWVILSQLRDKVNNLIETLIVENRDNTGGAFNLSAQDTTLWPVGTLYWDIEMSDSNGDKASTETLRINCLRDVSKV